MRALLCLFAITVAVHVYQRDRRTTEREAIAALDKEIERASKADSFSGTVVVARCGVPIYSKATNRANRERKTPNGIDTAFNLGSINKMFTAVATVRLVQDDKLALTDTVGKHIKDYPNRAIADNVTIHHLLTHTGGTGNIFDERYEEIRLELKTHDDYIRYFGERGPRYTPGKRFEYSNYGFVLLGAIIERVTGKNYYETVRELVFVPAGMSSTSFPLWNQPIGAIGYTKYQSRELVPNTRWLMYHGNAAGCGFSTALDLVRFANALRANKLLDAEHTKLLTTMKVRHRGMGYAYGFMEVNYDGVKCVGHNGGFPGVSTELVFCENGYTISALANFDPPTANRIAAYIARRLPKASPCVTPK